MAQINLLKQKSSTQSFAEALPNIAVKILVLVFLGACVYYGYLFFKAKRVSQDTAAVQGEIQSGANEVESNRADRDELLTRQNQISELGGLIKTYPYWSQLFPALAKATLKISHYTGIKMSNDGSVSLSASVPDLYQFDKFLQIFDLPEFNENFYDVHISSFAKSKGPDDSLSINFEAKMRFCPELVKYNERCANK